MDVYSFGLLVFWLLFRHKSLSDADETGISICNAFEGDEEHSIQKLERMKQNDELLDRALQLLSTQSGLNIELNRRLKTTFELSLGREPTSRASDMKPFVSLLCDDSFLESVIQPLALPILTSPSQTCGSSKLGSSYRNSRLAWNLAGLCSHAPSTEPCLL